MKALTLITYISWKKRKRKRKNDFFLFFKCICCGECGEVKCNLIQVRCIFLE
jgi:hypothetical protein